MMISGRWLELCQDESLGFNANVIWKLEVVNLDMRSVDLRSGAIIFGDGYLAIATPGDRVTSKRCFANIKLSL